MQFSHAPASSLHSKVAPVSLAENWKAAVVEVVSPVGPSVIDVSGLTVSIVHVRAASVPSVSPTASVART